MADEGMAGGGDQASSGGQQPGAFMANVPMGEKLLLAGAALILVVCDLIGDIFMDEYGIDWMPWTLAVAVVATIWAVRMGNRTVPISSKTVLVVLGYASLIVGIREFINNLDAADFPDGATLFFHLVYFLGAALLGIGAYQVARSND